VHAAIVGQEEVIEFLIAHVVVHDLPCGLFHVHVIRRVRQNEFAFSPSISRVYTPRRCSRRRSLDDAQKPQVSELGETGCFSFVHIEVIFFDLLVVDIGKELIYLRTSKPV
jgi:hypothetical protein